MSRTRIALAVIVGVWVAVMLTVILWMAPAEQGSTDNAPLAVQSAEAWYWTKTLCNGEYNVGGWRQHWYDSNSAHRSTKISSRYRAVGWVWVDIKKEKIHYVKRDGRWIVVDRDFVETDAVPCWRY